MIKLILCEGVTDAYFLSYYLEKTAGWKFSNKPPRNLAIKATNFNESVSWYKKDQDYLLICGVGGKDNFGNFFKNKIEKPLLTSNAFSRIAIVTDRDNRTNNDIIRDLTSSIEAIDLDMEDRKWKQINYLDDFKILNYFELLLVIIPNEHQGALETVMLDAICEDPYDKNIVDKASSFVKQMRIDASKYIKSDRLQLKAKLSVTWAIQSPEKVFSTIDELIKNVKWDTYDSLKQCFGILIDI